MTFPHSCCRNLKAEDWQVDVHTILIQTTSTHRGPAAALVWVYMEPGATETTQL